MGRTIGILVFDGAEEMDFVGPWEVLTAAVDGMPSEHVLTVAATPDPIVCEKGMRVIADATYDDVQALDVIVIPGGSGARREVDNPSTVEWLASIAAGCSWITSVCTGAFLLVGAGLADGKRVTTHHDFIQPLKNLDRATVIEGTRFVRDGKVVTAGGVMSGIEMSLWLVERLYGNAVAERTKSYIAYDYPPRSSSEGTAQA